MNKNFYKLRISSLGAAIISMSIILVQASNIALESEFAKIALKGLSIGVFVFFIIIALYVNSTNLTHRSIVRRRDKWLIVTCNLFVLFYIFSSVRGYVSGSVDFGTASYHVVFVITLWVFSLTLYKCQRWESDFASQIVWALCLSILLYLSANYVLYAFGVFGEERGIAVLLRSLGVHHERVRFILANGWNSFGVLSGAALAAGFMLMTGNRGKHSNWFLAAGLVLAGGVGVLAVDSRGALVFSLLTVVIVRVSLKYLPLALRLSPIIIPFAIMLAFYFLQPVMEAEWATNLSRGGGGASDNNPRLLIWASGLDVIDVASLNTYIGYGARGNYTAGVVDMTYQYLANIGSKTDLDIRGMTMHNAYLQYLFDWGVIGVFLYVALAIGVISKLIALHNTFPAARIDVLLAIFFYYIFYGNIEVVTSISHEGFVLFALIAFVVAASFLNTDGKIRQ